VVLSLRKDGISKNFINSVRIVFQIMPRNKRIIPLASLAREFYDENTSRVSTEALIELSEWLENYGLELSSKAWELCVNSGRKTLKDTDLKMARELLRKSQ